MIQELVETERNYSEVLSSLLRHFARPLSSLLRPEESARIFFGIKELSEIHVGFHSQLRKARNSAALAQVFLDWREKFLIYGDYCANLTLAQNTLQDACTRNELVNQEVIVSFALEKNLFSFYGIKLKDKREIENLSSDIQDISWQNSTFNAVVRKYNWK